MGKGMIEKMRKRILDYIQISMQGIGIASLGTLNIFEPKIETVILGTGSLLIGLAIAVINRR